MNLLTNARDALNAKYPGYHADKTLRITVREVGGICDLRLPICDLKSQGTGSPIANRKSKIENVSGVRGEPSTGKRWIRVTVADQGTGIPPEIQARIFDPFFTTKPLDKGTGLGLSISHGIVKDHHGALHFETAPGTGTQFHLDLPVDNEWRVEGE
jgi:signal transduction histidine kinase